MSSEAEIEQARSAVEEAIQRFVSLAATFDRPFMTGWAVAFEYTSADLDDEGNTADSVIVPTVQSRATSRGLFELGVDHFRNQR
ncbi:MAG: hypothetical protein K0S49_27 [Microbacterium sp.]|jgi:hypothetical protein|nr:hypothetical protein [Microbacterium sp.]